MEPLSVFYFTQIRNFGDALNAVLLPTLLKRPVMFGDQNRCELVSIGSLLEVFLHGGSDLRLLAKRIIFPKLHVWGTGFIAPMNFLVKRPQSKPETLSRRIKIHAVRGKLTKRRIQQITGDDLSTVTAGDPGLLSDVLLDGAYPKKSYRLGVVPHYIDNDDYSIRRIVSEVDHSLLINVLDDPLKVVHKIACCEVVLSSSLHGLIAADSLGVPNIRMICSDKIIGGDYKYDDYYTSLDVSEHKRIDVRKQKVTNEVIDNIEENYPVKSDKLNKVKSALMRCLPT